MNKKTRISIEIETDFVKVSGEHFSGDADDDFTDEVLNSFHNKMFEHFERKLTDDDNFQRDILMAMADDGELPKNIKEFNDLGSIRITISQNKEETDYNDPEVVSKIMSDHEQARNEDIAKHPDNWKKWENDFEHE